MSNKDRQGQIAIFPGRELREPCAVLVGGINGFGMNCLYKINSSELLIADPDNNDLLDFDYEKLELMRAEWQVISAKRNLSRLESELSELKKVKGG